MLGSEAPVRHPIRGEHTGWRTDNLKERALLLKARRVDRSGATRDRAPPGVHTTSIGPGRGPTGLRPLQCPLAALLPPFGAVLRFVHVGQALRGLPCGGLPLLRIMEPDEATHESPFAAGIRRSIRRPLSGIDLDVGRVASY